MIRRSLLSTAILAAFSAGFSTAALACTCLPARTPVAHSAKPAIVVNQDKAKGADSIQVVLPTGGGRDDDWKVTERVTTRGNQDIHRITVRDDDGRVVARARVVLQEDAKSGHSLVEASISDAGRGGHRDRGAPIRLVFNDHADKAADDVKLQVLAKTDGKPDGKLAQVRDAGQGERRHRDDDRHNGGSTRAHDAMREPDAGAQQKFVNNAGYTLVRTMDHGDGRDGERARSTKPTGMRQDVAVREERTSGPSGSAGAIGTTATNGYQRNDGGSRMSVGGDTHRADAERGDLRRGDEHRRGGRQGSPDVVLRTSTADDRDGMKLLFNDKNYKEGDYSVVTRIVQRGELDIFKVQARDKDGNVVARAMVVFRDDADGGHTVLRANLRETGRRDLVRLVVTDNHDAKADGPLVMWDADKQRRSGNDKFDGRDRDGRDGRGGHDRGRDDRHDRDDRHGRDDRGHDRGHHYGHNHHHPRPPVSAC
jgi:hypothetical protein